MRAYFERYNLQVYYNNNILIHVTVSYYTDRASSFHYEIIHIRLVSDFLSI